jgi:ketosteroid isomerase-like protein
VVTRDQLAIELDEMESTVTPVSNGMEVHAHVKIVIVYGRQADGEWKVARLMELLD